MKFPVDDVKDEILAAISAGEQILLRAPTGSGKSTRVPGMVADTSGDGLVIVVQPRRMAARLLAGFVARERGSSVGGQVGYAVRFDSKKSRDTRILYVTDGVLQRMLSDKPNLPGVKAVIFDEFHERRLASDIALGRCLDLAKHDRPDLRIIVMSATIETRGLEIYLDPCRVVEATGRTFPVDVDYLSGGSVMVQQRGGRRQPEMIWDTVIRALKKEIAAGVDGHILIFLPGLHEIRKTSEALSQVVWASGYEVHQLYSALSPEKQAAAVKSGGNPKIIVATNVAETSITIEEVTLVIDSGLARQSAFDVRRGFDSLTVKKISRASADQRAGRAGRTRAGRCLRLWSQADHAKRTEFETPEVHRVDLSECILQLSSAGWPNVRNFPWFESPKKESLTRAIELLDMLGAVEQDGSLTGHGKCMVTLPLHPRLSRLILAGSEYDCVAETCFAAAVLQGEGAFLRGKNGRKHFQSETDSSDFDAEFLAYETAVRERFDPRACTQKGLLARGAREIQQSLQQLRQMAKDLGLKVGDVQFHRRPEEFGRAMLMAYGDRVAIRLSPNTLACRVSGERKGQLEDDSAVKDKILFITTEMTEVEGRDLIVRLNRCVSLEEVWLEEMFSDHIHQRDGAVYDESRRRVIGLKETYFRDLAIERDERGEPDKNQAAELLAERVISGELLLKKWNDGVEQWIARLANLTEWMPELDLPGFSEEDKKMAIAQMCVGALSYKDIKDKDPWPVLRDWLSAPQLAVLDSFAPERITLSNGQTPKLRYERGAPPIIALKVQQLYGVSETPTICNGAVPLMIHICGPNMRPWQMTRDLESFWQTGMTQMKKDLAGRYPKHEWREGYDA